MADQRINDLAVSVNLQRIIDQSGSNRSRIGRFFVLPERLGRKLLARRNVVLKAIDETDGVLSADPPAAAFYVFASCAGAIGLITNDGDIIQNDLDMAAYLLKAAGVATIAGTAFGKSEYLRISYAVDDADLENACASIVAACKRLS